MYEIVYLPIAKQDITDYYFVYIRPVECAKGRDGFVECV